MFTAALQGIHDWPLFISAGLLLNLTPGADMALVARSSAGQGWRAGAAAALGVGAGCGLHIATAALGLGALLASSTAAFALLRWVGAAYLVWLGWGLLRSRPASAADDGAAVVCNTAQAWRRMFWQGFLTNALNPKVALFFLAFVPQFIQPGASDKALAFVALGMVFVINATAVNLGLAWGVARLRSGMGDKPGLQRVGAWLNRGVGALFITFGLRLAWGDGGR